MSLAFIFPGQGSQIVGMGKALADAYALARAVFEEVDAALGENLTKVIWEGPAETLTLTENAQPALMAVSLATMRVLAAEAGVDLGRDAQFVAGHSLGEYSALAAAGALSIVDTARLLRIRGRAMQKAVPVGTGAMAALLGLDFDQAVAVAEYSPSEWPATYSHRVRDRRRLRLRARAAPRATPPQRRCAFSVSVSVSAGPSQITLVGRSPSAASTSSNTARAGHRRRRAPCPCRRSGCPGPGK